MEGRQQITGAQHHYQATRPRRTTRESQLPSAVTSHTFLPPPSSMLLSYHAQGLTEAWKQPKVSRTGQKLADGGHGMSGWLFQAFVCRVIKKEPGGFYCSAADDISEGLFNRMGSSDGSWYETRHVNTQTTSEHVHYVQTRLTQSSGYAAFQVKWKKT